MSSNLTEAHRRGGKPSKAETTVLIDNGETPSKPNVVRATVRRKFFGTGPFDQHWLIMDCCGLFCALFTYSLHLYAVHVVCNILIPPWMSYKEEGEDEATAKRHLTWMGVFHECAFVAIALLAIVSHLYAMTTDPGTVPPDAKPLEEEDEEKTLANGKVVKRLCRRCRAFKPQRAHHCSVCQRCVVKMDHHCPWVNNCVGINNHKYFLLFVFYTFLSCAYSMILVIARFTSCAGDSHHGRYPRSRHSTCLDKPTQLISILGLLVEGLLFGMFTSCMMFDQSEVIFSKMTHIDKLKGTEISGSISGVAEVFGVGKTAASRFRLDWLSPFYKVCFPPSVRDEVMGFCRPCNTAAAGAASVATELTSRLNDVV